MFCNNCNSEIPEGTNICPKCGNVVNGMNAGMNQNYGINNDMNQGMNYGMNAGINNGMNSNMNGNIQPQNNEPQSKLDKYGKFYGIILLIVSLVGIMADLAFFNIIIGIAVIAGSIFCLSKKYRLKGFTIAALVLAIIGLLGGISQAGKVGLFRIPEKEKKETVEEVADAGEIMDAAETDDTEKNETEEITTDSSDDVTDSAEAYDTEDVQAAIAEAEAAIDELKADVQNELDEFKDSVDEVVDDAVSDAINDAIDSYNAEVDSTAETQSTPDKDPNVVDPELKAYLDSYEEFMDEYISFMKKYYSDPGNVMSLLADYTAIMVKYEDFAQKVEAYDPDTMSPADSAYYLAVMSRVELKLASVYFN